MFKIIYPSADATLYESLSTYNTGLDEILEVGKRLSTSGSNLLTSRALIKFDMNDITSALSKYNVDVNNCKFMMKLYTTHAKNLPATYTIDANLVGDEWDNGTGFQNLDTAVTDGCCWDSPKSGSFFWTSGSQYQQIPAVDGTGSLDNLTSVNSFNITGSSTGSYVVSSSNTNVTASIILDSTASFSSVTVTQATGIFNSGDNIIFTSQSLGATKADGTDIIFTLVNNNLRLTDTSLYITGSGKGGSWLYQSGSGIYSSSFYSQSFFNQPGLDVSESFDLRPTDINMDVTGAIITWISGSNNKTVPNNGFLLKFSESDEANTNIAGYVRFFSRDTHTIYVPRILMLFDKSTFATGSLNEFDIDSYKIYTNLRKEYKDTSVNKIRIFVRDKYPQKSPTNLFPQQTVKYLPADTLYSVIDAATEEIVIPYDSQYTKISCDSTSNFISIDMTGLMPERYYRLAFKVVSGFYEEFIEDDLFFKVVR